MRKYNPIFINRYIGLYFFMIHTLSASINYIDRSCTSKGHYPILSTVTGSLRIVSMTIAAIASTAFLTFHQGASSYYAFSKLDEKKIEQQKNVQQLLSFISQSFKQIGRGLIELIPVIGNLFVLIFEYRAKIAKLTHEKNSLSKRDSSVLELDLLNSQLQPLSATRARNEQEHKNKIDLLRKSFEPSNRDLPGITEQIDSSKITVDKKNYEAILDERNSLLEKTYQLQDAYALQREQRKELERVYDEQIKEYEEDNRQLILEKKALETKIGELGERIKKKNKNLAARKDKIVKLENLLSSSQEVNSLSPIFPNQNSYETPYKIYLAQNFEDAADSDEEIISTTTKIG